MVSPRNIKIALALLVITAIIGIVATIALKGSRTPVSAPVSKQLPQNIDVALHNARFTEMHDGIAVWELIADRAEYDKTGDVAYLSGIKMVYAKNRTNGSITLTASKGEYSNSSKNIRMWGKVHVVTESGMILDSETLDYIAKTALFKTVDRVNLQHERLSLTASGMEFEAKNEKSRFFRPVNAILKGMQPD